MLGTRACSLRAEENFFVISPDRADLAITQVAHHLVREAKLVDAVAEADSSIYRAHQLERTPQGRGVRMDIGKDAELHVQGLTAGRTIDVLYRNRRAINAQNQLAHVEFQEGARELSPAVRGTAMRGYGEYWTA